MYGFIFSLEDEVLLRVSGVDKKMDNKFSWLISSCFSYHSVFHLTGNFDDQKATRTSHIALIIHNISHLNI